MNFIRDGYPQKISGGCLEHVASKLEKNGKLFKSFNPFPSMPSVVTDDRKSFSTFK